MGAWPRAFGLRNPPRLSLCLVLLAAAGHYLGGCGSGAQLSNAWRDSGYTGPPPRSALILAMKKDAVARRVWEDAFAAELAGHGVRSTTSYQYFPDSVPDTTAIATAIAENALESVIVIKKLPNEENVRYVPGYVSTEPVTRYNPWRQTYEIWYREVHHPGYTETESTVRHEITMWVTRDTAILVWAGTGEVIDPSSAEAVKKEVVEMVVPELVKQKLIPPAS